MDFLLDYTRLFGRRPNLETCVFEESKRSICRAQALLPNSQMHSEVLFFVSAKRACRSAKVMNNDGRPNSLV